MMGPPYGSQVTMISSPAKSELYEISQLYNFLEEACMDMRVRFVSIEKKGTDKLLSPLCVFSAAFVLTACLQLSPKSLD